MDSDELYPPGEEPPGVLVLPLLQPITPQNEDPYTHPDDDDISIGKRAQNNQGLYYILFNSDVDPDPLDTYYGRLAGSGSEWRILMTWIQIGNTAGYNF